MADSINSTYVSNYIGQKLFAYIKDGNQINDRIKEKFAKSLIVIGNEGQIYNPLTNTYVGIGETKYSYTHERISEIDDKLNTLNTALTSSLVSGIYANWGKEDWEAAIESAKTNNKEDNWDTPEIGDNTIDFAKLGKIWATNDIIIKGIGNYDTENHRRSFVEKANVTDSNDQTLDVKNLVEQTAYSTYSETNNSFFADSGITVSLEKGLNKYRYVRKVVTDETTGTADTYELWIPSASVPADTYNYNGDASLTYKLDKDSAGTAIFMQGKNTLKIDDKMTWSYIAYTNSYTSNYAKHYTDDQINRIYSEILGISEPRLIPVTKEQVKEQVLNGSCTVTGTGEFGDNKLYNYELNKDSIYLYRLEIAKGEYTVQTAEDGTSYYLVKKAASDETANLTAYAYPEFTYLAWGEDGLTWKPQGKDIVVDIDADWCATHVFADVDKVIDEDLNLRKANASNGSSYIVGDSVVVNKYNSQYVYVPIYDLESFIGTNDAEIKDIKIYAVNQNPIVNSEINLADGLQTFKEVAYILDSITNGLQNGAEDGITLAYSIAYNYQWNKAQDDAIYEITSGKNAVVSLESSNNHKYVNTHLTSDIYPQVKFADTVCGDDNTTWYDAKNLYYLVANFDDDNSRESHSIRIHDSNIADYVLELNKYNEEIHKKSGSHDNGIEKPNILDFVDVPDEYKNTGDSNYWTYEIKIAEYFYNTKTDGTEDKLPAYIYSGRVDFSIDLNVANTYNYDDFNHADNTGYDLFTVAELAHTTKVTINVPAKPNYAAEASARSNENGYAAGLDSIDDLTATDQTTVNNALANYGITADGEGVTVEFKYIEGGRKGVTVDVEYTIAKSQTKDNYLGTLYVNKEGEYVAATDEDVKIAYASAIYTKYYLRRNPKVDKHADTKVDALVDVEWVTTYVKDLKAELDNSIKNNLIDSYFYTSKLIDRLDSNVSVKAGYYVSGITQNNGVVDIEATLLPKDEIISNATVWGATKEFFTPATITYNATTYSLEFDRPLYVVAPGKYTYIPCKANENITFDKEGDVTTFFKKNSDGAYESVTYSTTEYDLYNSLKLGPKYGNFTQYYTQNFTYELIDPADLRITSIADPNKVACSYDFDGTGISIITEFYNRVTPDGTKSTNYLTTASYQKTVETDGDGSTTLEVTAHIMPLMDAAKDNTGLVDAWDVRNTLDNLFEWVDLSEWTEENQNPMNMVGTEKKEDATE